MNDQTLPLPTAINRQASLELVLLSIVFHEIDPRGAGIAGRLKHFSLLRLIKILIIFPIYISRCKNLWCVSRHQDNSTAALLGPFCRPKDKTYRMLSALMVFPGTRPADRACAITILGDVRKLAVHLIGTPLARVVWFRSG